MLLPEGQSRWEGTGGEACDLVSKAGKSVSRVNGRRATFPCSELRQKKKSKHPLKLQYNWREEITKAEREDLTRKQGEAETKPRKACIERRTKRRKAKRTTTETMWLHYGSGGIKTNLRGPAQRRSHDLHVIGASGRGSSNCWDSFLCTGCRAGALAPLGPLSLSTPLLGFGRSWSRASHGGGLGGHHRCGCCSWNWRGGR